MRREPFELVVERHGPAVLQELPLKQRQTVAYHYLAGLPYAEVADILGGTPEAARRAGADGIAALRATYLNPKLDRGTEGEAS